MTLHISTTHANDRLNGTVSSLDRGTAHAKIRLYNGTQPAAGGSATTLLAEIVLTKPCGTVTGGVLTLTQENDYDIAVANGVATWARFIDGDGNWSIDCDVSDAAGSAPVKIDDTSIIAGGQVILMSAVLG